MAYLNIICGLPGSGKTTFAKELEVKIGALRLSPDEWISEILPKNYSRADLDRLRDPIERLQWQLGQKILSLGTNIIIEWGTWARSERLDLVAGAKKVGAKTKLYFLNPSASVLKERIQKRNENLPSDNFYVGLEEVDGWFKFFQIPDKEKILHYDEFTEL